MISRQPQPDPLKPLPAPLQAANRLLCELKPFRYSHPFHPKDLPLSCGRHHKPATPVSRDLLIGEKVLQFDRARHADWLKAVPRSPVPQPNRRAHPVGGKRLLSNSGSGLRDSFPRINSPRYSHPIKLNLPCPALQVHLRRTKAKLLRRSDLQMHLAREVANGITSERRRACPPSVLLPINVAGRTSLRRFAGFIGFRPRPSLRQAETHWPPFRTSQLFHQLKVRLYPLTANL